MFKKILYPFIIILFIFNFASLVYGDNIKVEVTKIRLVYQDGSSQTSEVSPSVSVTFRESDTTYDAIYIGSFMDLHRKDIAAINLYTGDGWLKADMSTTGDLNDLNLYNILGNSTIDLSQYNMIIAKYYYAGDTWLPTTPGAGPSNSAPSISQLTANPSSITYPNTSEISFNISDSNGDDISWTGSISGGSDKGSLSIDSGTVSGGSGSVAITYTPQNTDGSFTISINLDDGHGNESSDSVVITVASLPANNSPIISNLSASPNPIKNPPYKSNITFDVSDSDGDEVTWTATITDGPSPQGNITPSSGTIHGGSGNVSTKYQPVGGTPDGTFTIAIELDDGNSGADTDSIDIELDRD